MEAFGIGTDSSCANSNVQYYTGTYQHGGISMEEMLVPLVVLSKK